MMLDVYGKLANGQLVSWRVLEDDPLATALRAGGGSAQLSFHRVDGPAIEARSLAGADMGHRKSATRSVTSGGQSARMVAHHADCALATNSSHFCTCGAFAPDKFITPNELPTPYQAELLVILMEEAFEVLEHLGPRAAKCYRFGLEQVQPGQTETNAQRLGKEYGQLRAVMDRLIACDAIPGGAVIIARLEKDAALDKYMQHQPDAVPHKEPPLAGPECPTPDRCNDIAGGCIHRRGVRTHPSTVWNADMCRHDVCGKLTCRAAGHCLEPSMNKVR